MFKASQDINLNTSSGSDSNYHNSSIGGSSVPDISRIQVHNFPSRPVPTNYKVNFIINTCGVQGVFEVIEETPLGHYNPLPIQVLDAERLSAELCPIIEGVYRVYIKCNSINLPKSPYLIVVQNPQCETHENEARLPIFKSNALKVGCSGFGLQHIEVNKRMEFQVDASRAGNNILFVGICGPRGQCDEVSIKHVGSNIYNVIYQVQDPGVYLIAIKWGDDHIPGSPFQMGTV